MTPAVVVLFVLWALLLSAVSWWVAVLVRVERRSDDRASLERAGRRMAAWGRLYERRPRSY